MRLVWTRQDVKKPARSNVREGGEGGREKKGKKVRSQQQKALGKEKEILLREKRKRERCFFVWVGYIGGSRFLCVWGTRCFPSSKKNYYYYFFFRGWSIRPSSAS